MSWSLPHLFKHRADTGNRFEPEVLVDDIKLLQDDCFMRFGDCVCSSNVQWEKCAVLYFGLGIHSLYTFQACVDVLLDQKVVIRYVKNSTIKVYQTSVLKGTV